MSGRLEPVARSLGTLRTVFADPDLRRLEMAWLFTWTADLASAVALAIYAFDRGGAALVGVMALARALPGAFASAPASAMVDRHPRRLMLGASVLGRAGTGLLLMAGLFLGAPLWVVLLVAAADGTLSAAFYPAQSAITPELARSPDQLVAANVASSIIESIAIVLGPVGAALLLGPGGPAAVMAVAAVLQVSAAVTAFRIRRTSHEVDESDNSDAAGLLRSFGRSVAWLARHPDPRMVFALSSLRTMVLGAVGVFVVILAFDAFGLGQQGVGLLNGAVGIGGMIGGALMLALVGRRAAAIPFGWSAVLCAAPVALLSLGAPLAVALVFLALVGIGNTGTDVTTLIVIQRTVPGRTLGRIFGLVDAFYFLSISVGAVAASALNAAVGTRTAMLCVGLIVPVAVALGWRRLLRIDRSAVVPVERIALLRGSRLFAPLPAATLERLADLTGEPVFPAGSVVIREGDPGDRYYLIVSGTVRVSKEGEEVRTMGPGDGFGEIALLRDVPRTATVTAVDELTTLSLERDEFLEAVTGHAQARSAAESEADDRLGER